MVQAVASVSRYEDLTTGWSAHLAQALDELQDVEWTAFPFTAPWGNWTDDPLVQTAQYRLVGNIVQVRGLAKRNAAATGVVGTLPAGYRPPAAIIFQSTMNSPGYCRIDVSSTGVVTVAVGQTLPPNYASLDGVHFSVTA